MAPSLGILPLLFATDVRLGELDLSIWPTLAGAPCVPRHHVNWPTWPSLGAAFISSLEESHTPAACCASPFQKDEPTWNIAAALEILRRPLRIDGSGSSSNSVSHC
jgi:hypothetical protein